MTDRALDALDDLLAHGSPDARVRAAKLVLDRTAPASGPHSITAIVLPPPDAMINGKSPTDVIRARLAALAERQIEPSTMVTLDDLARRHDVIDAEIVPEPAENESEPRTG